MPREGVGALDPSRTFADTFRAWLPLRSGRLAQGHVLAWGKAAPGSRESASFSWEGFLSLPLRELSKGEQYCGQHLVVVSLQQGNLV